MRVVGGRWSVVGGFFEPLMGAEGADGADYYGGFSVMDFRFPSVRE